EGIVEGTSEHGRAQLVGDAADELHALGVGGHHEDDGEVLALYGDEAVMCDEGEVGQGRARGHHLGPRDVDARVRLLRHARADVGGATGGAGGDVTVPGR